MKNVFKSIAFLMVFSLFFACQEKENNSVQATEQSDKNPEEEIQVLESDKGEQITIVYFADGEKIAVKLTDANGKEHTLKGKGLNDAGGLVFTDGEVAWEMGGDARSGKLYDSELNFVFYRVKD